MNSYLLTSTNFTGEMEYRFDSKGVLQYFENRSQISDEYLAALIKVFPFAEARPVGMAAKSETITLVKVAKEITFDEFWIAYNYKVGNKARAQKLWNGLTITERALIMAYLPRYAAYLAARPRMEKAYAETFLSQRRWENELPK